MEKNGQPDNRICFLNERMDDAGTDGSRAGSAALFRYPGLGEVAGRDSDFLALV